MKDIINRDFIKLNITRCEAPKPLGFGHPLASWSVAEWGNATAGEVGEACNVAKKLLRFRDNVAGNKETQWGLRQKLGREIADGIIYSILWAASQGIDLNAEICEAFDEKSKEIGSPYKWDDPK